jgi:hypothetical protein
MKRYEFQLLKYIHDRGSSEFVYIGVVIFDPETRFLKSQFISKYSRLSNFFKNVHGPYLLSVLKQVENHIERISKRANDASFNYKDISSITNSVVTRDDSVLEFAELRYGFDIDFDAALTDLFDDFVNKYSHDNEDEVHDDRFVWKNVYKQYFDKYEISKILKPHSVKTKNDTIEFDKSWKNGVLHCYQPLSFDLKNIDNIKNKVYKWSGILNALEQSNEELHIHFLTINSEKQHSVQKFIDDTFSERSFKTIKVSIVKENQAEEFALKVKNEILEHNQ